MLLIAPLRAPGARGQQTPQLAASVSMMKIGDLALVFLHVTTQRGHVLNVWSRAGRLSSIGIILRTLRFYRSNMPALSTGTLVPPGSGASAMTGIRKLNYQHLLYFWSVVRTGSLTRASIGEAV